MIKTKYPTRKLYYNIAEKHGFSILKVENWFKHKRRNDFASGKLKFYVLYLLNNCIVVQKKL